MESGQGQNGPWYKQKMVIETYGQYPKTVAITFFGAEKINALAQFPVGTPVKVSLNLESREHQGKWYDSINGWKVEHGSATAAPVAGYVQPAAPAPAPAPAPQPAPQNLQAQVSHAQQNYQVQPVWNGYGWVHPHTGQPMNPPAPAPQAAAPAPQQPAPAPAPQPAPAPAPAPQPQYAAPQPQFAQQAAPAPWDGAGTDVPF